MVSAPSPDIGALVALAFGDWRRRGQWPLGAYPRRLHLRGVGAEPRRRCLGGIGVWGRRGQWPLGADPGRRHLRGVGAESRRRCLGGTDVWGCRGEAPPSTPTPGTANFVVSAPNPDIGALVALAFGGAEGSGPSAPTPGAVTFVAWAPNPDVGAEVALAFGGVEGSPLGADPRRRHLRSVGAESRRRCLGGTDVWGCCRPQAPSPS